MIRQVDNWLLDKVFTPVATWIRDRNDSTQYDLAREGIFSGFALIIIGSASWMTEKPLGWHTLVCIAFDLLLWFVIKPFENRMIHQAQAKGPGWNRCFKLSSRTFQLFWLALVIWSTRNLWGIISAVGYVLFVSSYYFRAVTLPPPKPREEFKVAFA